MSVAAALQYILPHRALSRLVYWATRWTWKPWKDFLIRRVIAAYAVDMQQARDPDPSAYPTFSAFFTRELRADARPMPDDPAALVSPADGRISQIGAIGDDAAARLFQAKGFEFSAGELLGDDEHAALYRGGRFATIYLSPRDYHRVHMPLGGALVSTTHIPGRLFSVAPWSVAEVPRLFARNERLVCRFDGDHGPFCVVLVGAMLVSSVETVWAGVEIPPYASGPVRRDWRGRGIRLERGVELGRFNMGSTVIVLMPPASAEWNPGLGAESPVRVRQAIGALHRPAA
jgi:phosphatidylserine decarboxylase